MFLTVEASCVFSYVCVFNSSFFSSSSSYVLHSSRLFEFITLCVPLHHADVGRSRIINNI